MTMVEIDPCLIPFMPQNGELAALTTRFYLTSNPPKSIGIMAYESVMYIAIQCHSILSKIAERAPEEGHIIAGKEGLVSDFEQACFNNIGFLPDDRAEASRLLHQEFQRLTKVQLLPMRHGTLEQFQDGTIRIVPRQPK